MSRSSRRVSLVTCGQRSPRFPALSTPVLLTGGRASGYSPVNMKLNFKFIFVAGLVCVPGMAVAAAQDPQSSRVHGKVVDSSGAAVVGAEVVVVASDTT